VSESGDEEKVNADECTNTIKMRRAKQNFTRHSRVKPRNYFEGKR